MKIEDDVVLTKIEENDIENGVFIVPNGISVIKHEAGKGLRTLQSLIMGDNVAFVGAEAFYQCFSLKSIILSDNLCSIEKRAFASCTGLNRVATNNTGNSIVSELPLSLKTIGEEAFKRTALGAINFGSNSSKLKTLDKKAFEGTELTEVTIPHNIETVGNGCFSNCMNLKKVSFSPKCSDIHKFAFLGSAINEIVVNSTEEEYFIVYKRIVFDVRNEEKYSILFQDGCVDIFSTKLRGRTNPFIIDGYLKYGEYGNIFTGWEYNGTITPRKKKSVYIFVAYNNEVVIEEDLAKLKKKIG